jgi:hypothetical protein
MANITPLPAPPTRADPTNFNDRADEFLAALEDPFVPELNALRTELLDASEDAVTASATAVASKDIAVNAADAAQFTADALMWNAATNYVQGQPESFENYLGRLV